MSTIRKASRLDDPQFDLFGGVPTEGGSTEVRAAQHSGRHFVTGNSSALFVGTVQLEHYLRDMGELTPLSVARLLDEQDWQVFEQRKTNRRKWGKGTDSLRISASEPQAMVQRLKRGRGFAASYTPSVLANEDRIITAMAVDSSSETSVMAQMLDQHARIAGSQTKEVLLDAGYFDDEVIAATLERDVSLLCPSGQWPAPEEKSTGKFHKSRFQYDSYTDTYRCPAEQVLTRVSTVAPSAVTHEQTVYASLSCNGCPLRNRCTSAKVRKIKRYPEDEAREALRLVMEQPGAQRAFCQRKAMVEPVFAMLRYQQRLDRFRRRGLAAVKREFALHAMAYNLARAVGLLKALFAYFYAIFLVQSALVARLSSPQPHIKGYYQAQTPSDNLMKSRITQENVLRPPLLGRGFFYIEQ